MQAASLRFSPALWRRGRGPNLRMSRSQASPLNGLPGTCAYRSIMLYHEKSTYKPLRDLGVETKYDFPQGLKPNSPCPRNGTAEAVPFQGLLSVDARDE